MLIRNSQPFIFAIFLIGIIVIGVAYVMLSKPLEITYNKYYNHSSLADDAYQQFYTRSKTVWTWLLLVAAIVMILWAVRKAQEKNDYGLE